MFLFLWSVLKQFKVFCVCKRKKWLNTHLLKKTKKINKSYCLYNVKNPLWKEKTAQRSSKKKKMKGEKKHLF